MQIHRSHPAGRFTIIPDDALRDPRLSYAARGVLAEILSRPDDWRTSADATWKRARRERGRQAEGRRGIAAAFAELAAAGYLVRVRTRGPTGRMVTELHVYDCPQARESSGESPEPSVSAGMSVPPAETGIAAGHTDIPPPGMSVPPGQTDVLPVRTDIPPTDMPVNGRSIQRPTTETELTDNARAASLGTETNGGPPVAARRAAVGGTQRNGANPSHSLREHDGPDYDGPDDQHFSVEVLLQSQAADRNAREDDEAIRQAAARALDAWMLRNDWTQRIPSGVP